MTRQLHAVLVCGVLVPLGLVSLPGLVRAQGTVRIAPTSNGVEVDEIEIRRRTSLGALKNADLTNMHLGLWFSADWDTDGSRAPALVHLRGLAAIEDDTGRVLTTEGRLKDVEHLRGEVRARTWKGEGGKGGPVINLRLDAPARGAGKIKAIKGTAEVTLTRRVELTFNDLTALDGKALEHPKLKDLAAMKLRFSVAEKDGKVSAKLSAPIDFTSPWNLGRLHDWGILDGGEDLRPSSIGGSVEGDGVTEEKAYRGRTVKGLSLRLTVLEAVETKTFKFHFQDVELP